jgi:hypothetical protein
MMLFMQHPSPAASQKAICQVARSLDYAQKLTLLLPRLTSPSPAVLIMGDVTGAGKLKASPSLGSRDR